MDCSKSKIPKPRSKIAEARLKAGLTQKALADELEVTVNTVANWENGRGDLRAFVNVVKLCDILSCSPKDLIELNDVDSKRNALSLEKMREYLGTNELQVTSVTDKQEKVDS